MQSKATTVKEYLDQLPEDRRRAMMALRKVIKANLGKGFKEGIQYGMIGYFVPHSVFPPGYHCSPDQPLPFASIASQKNHMAFYSFFLYQDSKELERFQKAWKASGNKLDMGKSCVRFKKLENVPLEVIGDAVARQDCNKYVAAYEKTLGASGKPTSTRKKAASKKTTAKKAASKKAAKKAPAKKKVAKKKVTKKAATKKAPAKKASSKKRTAKKRASSVASRIALARGGARRKATKKTARKAVKRG